MPVGEMKAARKDGGRSGLCRFWLGGYGNGEGEFDCLAGVAVNRIGQFIIADRSDHLNIFFVLAS